MSQKKKVRNPGPTSIYPVNRTYLLCWHSRSRPLSIRIPPGGGLKVSYCCAPHTLAWQRSRRSVSSIYITSHSASSNSSIGTPLPAPRRWQNTPNHPALPPCCVCVCPFKIDKVDTTLVFWPSNFVRLLTHEFLDQSRALVMHNKRSSCKHRDVRSKLGFLITEGSTNSGVTQLVRYGKLSEYSVPATATFFGASSSGMMDLSSSPRLPASLCQLTEELEGIDYLSSVYS